MYITQPFYIEVTESYEKATSAHVSAGKKYPVVFVDQTSRFMISDATGELFPVPLNQGRFAGFMKFTSEELLKEVQELRKQIESLEEWKRSYFEITKAAPDDNPFGNKAKNSDVEAEKKDQDEKKSKAETKSSKKGK